MGADIEHVGDAGRPSDQLALPEQRDDVLHVSVVHVADERVVVTEDVAGRNPGVVLKVVADDALIASDMVWTWTMIPVESVIESPSGVYSAKHSSPISLTIGDAEMFSAVSRALTIPPRSREKIFS